ncbi:DUF3810 domain-containing protein [Sphingobacterium sp. UT-1RO-CII-1]|uniref:DUF3810 domain-containing protein n=1 Tax=Sphingobacterium sp. UT-1RO-CII-1 TaxID=2995225 RepID=UPI00227ACE44|nr:DUF3810 domain-containing protein [Sphingobacterium sp. UT-1RO-CII-1]MCY4781362.1 DUF3810 domain-containing protein [Sphingobacterium sp. UT-1RO-CII-1]
MRKQVVILFILLLLVWGLSIIKSYSFIIENYYSRAFYPFLSHFFKFLFQWVPFSVGDVFYLVTIVFYLILGALLFINLLKKNGRKAASILLKLVNLGLGLYVLFYISWGLNYYRQPLSVQMELQVDNISKSDYILVLDKYIEQTNSLREKLDLDTLLRERADLDLSIDMLNDKVLKGILSKTQVKVKSPLSSEIVSFFTVTGYFNPFTQEVQVNKKIPLVAYPFTVVHELGHQMGIGFEDECNFIAFLKLRDHSNTWYRYAVNYEIMQYLLRPLYSEDREKYNSFLAKLSPKVIEDMQYERDFWKSYTSWFNTLTNLFYTRYLTHNNQPEGMTRYSMVSKLVVAWELKNRGL